MGYALVSKWKEGQTSEPIRRIFESPANHFVSPSCPNSCLVFIRYRITAFAVFDNNARVAST